VVTPPPEPPAPPVVHDGQRPAPARWPYATGAAADQLITDARVARNFGHTEDALDAYEKALSSSRATDAAHEALTLLARAKRPLDLCTLAAALPPERCDDTVRLLHGRTLVDLGRPAEAIPVLAGIGSRSSEAGEGQLIIARALIRSGRADAGRTILSRLAKGRDAIAAQARDDLGR
jgi:predicted Zn-dependent protease